MKNRTYAIVLIFCCVIGCVASAAAVNTVQDATISDAYQQILAQRWSDAFDKLDNRSNITIVIGCENNSIEIQNVEKVETYSSILIVSAEGDDGRLYKSLVYPGSILLIKEGSRRGR